MESTRALRQSPLQDMSRSIDAGLGGGERVIISHDRFDEFVPIQLEEQDWTRMREEGNFRKENEMKVVAMCEGSVRTSAGFCHEPASSAARVVGTLELREMASKLIEHEAKQRAWPRRKSDEAQDGER